MLFIIAILHIFLFVGKSLHLFEDEGYKDKSCSVIINGVDLSTKVNGKIISYKGSVNDQKIMMTKSLIKVMKPNGELMTEIIMVPIK